MFPDIGRVDCNVCGLDLVDEGGNYEITLLTSSGQCAALCRPRGLSLTCLPACPPRRPLLQPEAPAPPLQRIMRVAQSQAACRPRPALPLTEVDPLSVCLTALAEHQSVTAGNSSPSPPFHPVCADQGAGEGALPAVHPQAVPLQSVACIGPGGGVRPRGGAPVPATLLRSESGAAQGAQWPQSLCRGLVQAVRPCCAALNLSHVVLDPLHSSQVVSRVDHGAGDVECPVCQSQVRDLICDACFATVNLKPSSGSSTQPAVPSSDGPLLQADPAVVKFALNECYGAPSAVRVGTPPPFLSR